MMYTRARAHVHDVMVACHWCAEEHTCACAVVPVEIRVSPVITKHVQRWYDNQKDPKISGDLSCACAVHALWCALMCMLRACGRSVLGCHYM